MIEIEDSVALNTSLQKDARRAKIAVILMFAVHGASFASIVPWIPFIKSDLAISNFQLGITIAAIPLGTLIFGLLAKSLINRFGSYQVSVASGWSLSLIVPLISMFDAWSVVLLLFLVFGIADAWMDTAMNTQGIYAQRLSGRSLIVGFHGAESIGAVLGGCIAIVAISFHISMQLHFVITGLLLCLLILISISNMPRMTNHEERENHSSIAAVKIFKVKKTHVFAILSLAILLMLSGGVEDSASTWGAIYMQDEVGASPFLFGIPFIACQVCMIIGRLKGDRIADKLGDYKTACLGGGISTIGTFLFLIFPTTPFTILGFGLLGLGMSVIFPLGLAAAGNIPGVRTSDGVTFVSWLSRIGFLSFPPLVGLAADTNSLRTALIIIAIASGFTIILSAAVKGKSHGL